MEQELRELKIGDSIVYVDEQGKPHNALVTAVHGRSCCNLLFVRDNLAAQDPYGHQTERRSSNCHKSRVEAPGNYWVHVDERESAKR